MLLEPSLLLAGQGQAICKTDPLSHTPVPRWVRAVRYGGDLGGRVLALHACHSLSSCTVDIATHHTGFMLHVVRMNLCICQQCVYSCEETICCCL